MSTVYPTGSWTRRYPGAVEAEGDGEEGGAVTPGTGPAPVRVPDPREVSRSSHQTPTPTETPTRTATARAASTRRTRWGGCAGPAGAVITGVQGGTGEAWVPAVAQGGAN